MIFLKINIQDGSWATKVKNIKAEGYNGDKESGSIIHEEIDFVRSSDTPMGFDRMKRGMAINCVPSHTSYDDTITNQEEHGTSKEKRDNCGNINHEHMDAILVANQKLIDKIEQLNNEMTTLKKEIADLKKEIEDNSIKSRKTELENNIQTESDSVKSYLDLKAEVSTIKEKLHMVYGRNFFQGRK